MTFSMGTVPLNGMISAPGQRVMLSPSTTGLSSSLPQGYRCILSMTVLPSSFLWLLRYCSVLLL